MSGVPTIADMLLECVDFIPESDLIEHIDLLEFGLDWFMNTRNVPEKPSNASV